MRKQVRLGEASSAVSFPADSAPGQQEKFGRRMQMEAERRGRHHGPGGRLPIMESTDALELKETSERGGLFGIGIKVDMDPPHLVQNISNIKYSNNNSLHDRVNVGDSLVLINGERCVGSMEWLEKAILGPKNSALKLGFVRGDVGYHAQVLKEETLAFTAAASTVVETKQANVKAGLRYFQKFGADNHLQRAHASDDSSSGSGAGAGDMEELFQQFIEEEEEPRRTTPHDIFEDFFRNSAYSRGAGATGGAEAGAGAMRERFQQLLATTQVAPQDAHSPTSTMRMRLSNRNTAACTKDIYEVEVKRHVPVREWDDVHSWIELREAQKGRPLLAEEDIVLVMEELRRCVVDGSNYALDFLPEENVSVCSLGMYFQQEMSNERNGLGPNKIQVLVPASPAHSSGKLQKGDEIVAVDGVPAHAENLTKLLRGSDVIGSKCRVTAKRPGKATFDVELARTSAFAVRNTDYFVNLVDSLEHQMLQRESHETMMPSLQAVKAHFLETERRRCSAEASLADRLWQVQSRIVGLINRMESMLRPGEPDLKDECQRLQALTVTLETTFVDTLEQKLVLERNLENYIVETDNLQKQLEKKSLEVATMSGMSKTEKEELSRALESEKQRRREQAKRIGQRLLKSQLAYAFDWYACRVSDVRRKRDACRRVVLRMQHVALAGAFDMFIGTVGQLKAHRQMVERAMCRWKVPAIATAMWAWMEYIQVVAQERKEESLDQTRNQLSGMSDVAKTENKKARCKRIIQRMLHRQLTAAFDCFYEAISLRVEHRTLKEQLQQKRDEANSLRAALSEMVFCAEFSQVKGILHTKDKEIAGMREQILKQTEQVEGLKLELKTLKNMHAKTVMFPRSEHLAS
jgi:hypothetical protein